ncbi:hypothetical protein ACJQWK_05216 [Exserohilum turcicum]
MLRNGEPFVPVDTLHFRSLLRSRVELLSPRFMLCFRLVSQPVSDAGLSSPRPPVDGRITLPLTLAAVRCHLRALQAPLHEAMHAFFFVTTSCTHLRADDGTDDGSYSVTIHRSFHHDVDSYRAHVWKCDGPCHTQPPYSGLVKRTMNRPPARSDNWWPKHHAECGGSDTKIHEPAPTKKQLQAMTTKERAGRQKNRLDGCITTAPAKQTPDHDARRKLVGLTNDATPPASSYSRDAQSLAAEDLVSPAPPPPSTSPHTGQKRPRSDPEHGSAIQKKLLVDCPICHVRTAEADMNHHLDVLHC